MVCDFVCLCAPLVYKHVLSGIRYMIYVCICLDSVLLVAYLFINYKIYVYRRLNACEEPTEFHIRASLCLHSGFE